MASKRQERRINLRVYADTDPQIYAWLGELAGQALQHGEKAVKIKEVLRCGLQVLGLSGEPEAAAVPAVDTGVVQALSAALPETLADALLARMRPVMEAAVVSAIPQALHGLPLALHPPDTSGTEGDEEAAFFATLEDNLFLDDEDEENTPSPLGADQGTE